MTNRADELLAILRRAEARDREALKETGAEALGDLFRADHERRMAATFGGANVEAERDRLRSEADALTLNDRGSPPHSRRRAARHGGPHRRRRHRCSAPAQGPPVRHADARGGRAAGRRRDPRRDPERHRPGGRGSPRLIVRRAGVSAFRRPGPPTARPGPGARNPRPRPARTPDGRLLDVSEDASPEETAEAVARREAEDARAYAERRRAGRHNGSAEGWLGTR